MKNNKKGFTLIELLVVISIIGLLSTLAVVSLNNARSKARDARRTSDVKSIQTAMELYKADNSDVVPDLNGSDWTTLEGQLLEYLPSGLPVDPGNDQYVICTDSGGDDVYMIYSQLENAPVASGTPATGWDDTADDCIVQTGGTLAGGPYDCELNTGGLWAFCMGQND